MKFRIEFTVAEEFLAQTIAYLDKLSIDDMGIRPIFRGSQTNPIPRQKSRYGPRRGRRPLRFHGVPSVKSIILSELAAKNTQLKTDSLVHAVASKKFSVHSVNSAVSDLVSRGLVHRVKPGTFTVTKEGRALIGQQK